MFANVTRILSSGRRSKQVTRRPSRSPPFHAPSPLYTQARTGTCVIMPWAGGRSQGNSHCDSNSRGWRAEEVGREQKSVTSPVGKDSHLTTNSLTLAFVTEGVRRLDQMILQPLTNCPNRHSQLVTHVIAADVH